MVIYKRRQSGIPHEGFGIGDDPSPYSCLFSFVCCRLLGFQLNFLYFINSPWKSAFNKKDCEDIDDVTGSWDSQVCVQTKDCFG